MIPSCILYLFFRTMIQCHLIIALNLEASQSVCSLYSFSPSFHPLQAICFGHFSPPTIFHILPSLAHYLIIHQLFLPINLVRFIPLIISSDNSIHRTRLPESKPPFAFSHWPMPSGANDPVTRFDDSGFSVCSLFWHYLRIARYNNSLVSLFSPVTDFTSKVLWVVKSVHSVICFFEWKFHAVTPSRLDLSFTMCIYSHMVCFTSSFEVLLYFIFFSFCLTSSAQFHCYHIVGDSALLWLSCEWSEWHITKYYFREFASCSVW